MMTHEVPVRYTDETVRQAARLFLARFLRRNGVIGAVAVLLALAGSWGFGIEWPYTAALGGLGLLLIALTACLGFAYVRSAATKFRALRDPTVTWRFGEQSLGTTSDLGSAEIPWEAVSDVWQFPGAWLLFFGKRGWGYSTLPTGDLSPELQDYILSRVKAHGGRVA